MDLKQHIAEVRDFPQPGIVFRDITPLLQNPSAFKQAIDEFIRIYQTDQIDVIVAIEARGFFFAAPLAYQLEVPLVPIRRRGKLPRESVGVEYSLEYGSNNVEMHRDSIHDGQQVLIIDDLLATGGTAAAAIRLVERLGGEVVGIAFLVELEELNGRSKIEGYRIDSLIKI